MSNVKKMHAMLETPVKSVDSQIEKTEKRILKWKEKWEKMNSANLNPESTIESSFEEENLGSCKHNTT